MAELLTLLKMLKGQLDRQQRAADTTATHITILSTSKETDDTIRVAELRDKHSKQLKLVEETKAHIKRLTELNDRQQKGGR